MRDAPSHPSGRPKTWLCVCVCVCRRDWFVKVSQTRWATTTIDEWLRWIGKESFQRISATAGILIVFPVKFLTHDGIIRERTRIKETRWMELISNFYIGHRYEPWIGGGGSSNDQSSYKVLVPSGTRKPAEDLRTATKLELNAAAPPSVTKSVGAVVAAPSTSLYAWKMSGFSQCSASCLGGIKIVAISLPFLSFLITCPIRWLCKTWSNNFAIHKQRDRIFLYCSQNPSLASVCCCRNNSH